jgi:glutathione synthase/RimK-type ligase-like ATP-grasp enzyme
VKRVAIVTASSLPEAHPDDLLLARALRERGCEVAPAAWDDSAFDWRAFEVAVLRSPWNYHLRADEFGRWIDSLAAAGISVVNPPETVRWNLHKRYLLDLAAAGVPVVPTELVRASDLSSRIAAARWDEIVVKPAVSASAYQTYRLTRGAKPPSELAAATREIRDWIVQPFVKSVLDDGERSAICIDGAVSHVVRKVASGGDFRVQADFGGTVLDEPLSADDARFVFRVLAALPVRWVYARIDWANVPVPLVMEVELIEPELFLTRRPDSVQNLATALLRAAT